MLSFRNSLTVLLSLLLAATPTHAEGAMEGESVRGMEGRMIIRHLQELIRSHTGYSREELAKRVPAFQALYQERMAPRLEEVAVYISPTAMQWVDIDWDGEPEFIFWTEGLSAPEVHIKEYLYIVKMNINGDGYVMKAVPLEPGPSISGSSYKYSRFWARPNQGRDINPEVRALLTYGSFGDINVAYNNLEIRWNAQQQKIMVNQFRTYFPVAVEGLNADVY